MNSAIYTLKCLDERNNVQPIFILAINHQLLNSFSISSPHQFNQVLHIFHINTTYPTVTLLQKAYYMH